ncbi:MAG TPA: hypothetical protein G4O08_11130 [Anaerolineae bacterium]|nr:hypothetical protein [Anaerolineae bacterium]
MHRKLGFLMIVMILAPCLGIAAPGIAGENNALIVEQGTFTPENTIIVGNEMDARFSRDFSVLLKRLRLEWILLESTDIPASIQDKNWIVLGHPDAEYSGDLIRELLTAEEIETLLAATDHHVNLEIGNPWMEDRSIIICSGPNSILRRNAAEDAVRAIIADAPPASDWLRSTYEAELDFSLESHVTQLQYAWDDDELPLEDLSIDMEVSSPRSITSRQAAEDVSRLFYIFSHGYAGYAFFNQNGAFEQAEANILEALSSRASWSTDAFSALLHEHLSFVTDCHMRIGDHRFFEHSDFWYDTQFELTSENSGYRFSMDGTTYTLVSINGADPQAHLFPSLNLQGDPIYRLGTLSSTEPVPLLLVAEGNDGDRQWEIPLQRSDFDYYSESIFDEDRIGGIPVLRVRGFGDADPDDLNQFVETGSRYRDEPVVVVDLRGNGGGNERWPVAWIQRLTGARAESVFAVSELESATSMVGRANAFAYWLDQVPDSDLFQSEFDRYTRMAGYFENGMSQPRWTGPVYPEFSLIPNDTTIVVVTNELVASAGEGMVTRISRVENVVIVGENTMGALTFGNVSTHKLPHSGLMVWLSINFNFFLDQQFREQVGLSPDLWIPAADAVNYAVAAVRRGTITTVKPLSQETLNAEFVPESEWGRIKNTVARSGLVILIFFAGSLVWSYFIRKKPRIILAVGVVWLVLGGAWFLTRSDKTLGISFLGAALTMLIWGICSLWLARKSGQQFNP